MYLCHHFIFSHGFFYSKWWQAASFTLFFFFLAWGSWHTVQTIKERTPAYKLAPPVLSVSFLSSICLSQNAWVHMAVTENCSCYMSSWDSSSSEVWLWSFLIYPQDQEESGSTPSASAQASAAEGNSGSSMLDIFSSMLKDTTSEHRAHLFDLNCKICTGK